MFKTKTRKQGNSMVVTLPSASDRHIEVNQEYIVNYESNGTITLVPKIEDPFTLEEEGAYYEADVWEM